ncbi:hypothetical protein RJ639_011313 [Escallonia herrerae]|uniref:Sulfotransferase n=1 Tax=Escallonia herrerae TaxID=1293975 RepID=A0AA89AP80_9ASTE|nr:hypothetical protein RJ639_011313 [Escallonia herrerae]
MESSTTPTGCITSSLPEEKWWESDEPLYQFNGFWFRLSNLQGVQQVLEHFKPLATDVILASFPKTGTTWLKSLLYSIINRSSKESLISNHPHDLVPSLELQLYKKAQVDISTTETVPSTGTRVFSTHIPYQLFTDHTIRSSECRIVYITRNPKDALNSFWHFVSKSGTETWPLEVAVDKFCHGIVPFGPYYDHVLGYRKESLERPRKVLFVTYEELQNDTKTCVKKLGEFLGCPFDKEPEVEEIVKSCSIETLKRHEVNKSSDFTRWIELPYNSFFRQGGLGDHKNYMSAQMIERIDAITLEKFHESGFIYGI